MLGGICTGQLYSKHSISHSITHSIIQDRGNSYIKESFLPQCDYATLLQKCFSITLSCPTRNGRNVWRSISTPPQVESVHTTLTWQNCHPKSQQLWGVVDAWGNTLAMTRSGISWRRPRGVKPENFRRCPLFCCFVSSGWAVTSSPWLVGL